MIYRIPDEERWRKLLTMLQTKYNSETEAWTSCNEPGQFSFETQLGSVLEDICEDSPKCVEIDYADLRDKLHDLYWDARVEYELAVEANDDAEQDRRIAEFDKRVVDICMKHVRPRYPVLVSVIDMEIGGGREGKVWKLMHMRIQMECEMDTDPFGYQTLLWHLRHHFTVDEFIERIRANGPWHVHHWISQDNAEFCEPEAVLDMIDKARDCFADTGRADGVATRLDIDWNQFSQAYVGEACWADKSGKAHSYMFVQDRKNAGSA